MLIRKFSLGMEGKAGMAAIVDENQNTNLNEFASKLKEMLPPYARPVFLRLCKEVETTGKISMIYFKNCFKFFASRNI